MLSRLLDYIVETVTGEPSFIYNLPFEITGNIIFRAGGISLIKLVSKSLTKLYSKVIEEHNFITQPISSAEIKQYLDEEIKVIYTFHYAEDKMIACSYKPYCDSFIDLINKNISFSMAGAQTYIHLPSRLESFFIIKRLVTGYELANYDLLTIFNIITNRSNKYVAKKVCIDTFNYYCNILKNEALFIYLYVNLSAINQLYQYTGLMDYQSKLIESQKQELLEKLNGLCDDDDIEQYYHYSSYAIRKK